MSAWDYSISLYKNTRRVPRRELANHRFGFDALLREKKSKIDFRRGKKVFIDFWAV